ncbi:ferritin-like domain-containing protein [Roseospirillum parvum]|uniref:Rubrerythrin n=1 Tax=Roseospirillum parvum TaxID=83401 RepID=A0A1G8B687_9PROT|nr:ferritin-like domain-containing protein [Roseospirillum parvum]SDH28739.1 Rubrerythrin [Roseospirillum parvum]
MARWTLDDIDWSTFSVEHVDASVMAVVRAAALVERNGADYARYLKNVFADDPDFLPLIDAWAAEEIQHGDALGRWAELADPGFDYRAAFDRFRAGYALPLEATASVRGSKSGELIARSIVESGTSSFYSALRDATDEPVLKDIAHRVAGDEFRHYKLFMDHARRHLARDRLSLPRRFGVALGRFREADDEELSFAYHCANNPPEAPFDHKASNRAYATRAFRLYRPEHCDRGSNMILKAAGLDPKGRLGWLARRLFWGYVSLKSRAPEAA